eukprot:SAG11_NODE_23432_length_388_cov_2.519031_1_plen_53_part_10
MEPGSAKRLEISISPKSLRASPQRLWRNRDLFQVPQIYYNLVPFNPTPHPVKI